MAVGIFVQYDDSDLQWHAVDETWVYSRRSQRNDAKRQRADSIFACQTMAIKRTKAASTLKRGQRSGVLGRGTQVVCGHRA